MWPAAAVAPELTVAAVEPVVPLALAEESRTAAPFAVERPAYSSAVIPMSDAALAVAVIVGWVPPL